MRKVFAVLEIENLEEIWRAVCVRGVGGVGVYGENHVVNVQRLI